MKLIYVYFLSLVCFVCLCNHYLLFSFHGAQELYYKIKLNQQQTTTL